MGIVPLLGVKGGKIKMEELNEPPFGGKRRWGEHKRKNGAKNLVKGKTLKLNFLKYMQREGSSITD